MFNVELSESSPNSHSQESSGWSHCRQRALKSIESDSVCHLLLAAPSHSHELHIWSAIGPLCLHFHACLPCCPSPLIKLSPSTSLKTHFLCKAYLHLHCYALVLMSITELFPLHSPVSNVNDQIWGRGVVSLQCSIECIHSIKWILKYWL